MYTLVYLSCAVLLVLGSSGGLCACQMELTGLFRYITAACICFCCQMGNCLMSYRAEIGLFYNRCQKVGRTCKVSMSIYLSLSQFPHSRHKTSMPFNRKIVNVLLCQCSLHCTWICPLFNVIITVWGYREQSGTY